MGQPAWILGARKLFTGIDGTCRYNRPIVVDPKVPFTSDMHTVSLHKKRYRISGSRPFLGFQSDNQGFLHGANVDAATQLARRNKEPRQRDVDPQSPYSFQQQVRAWYSAVSLTAYGDAIQPVLQEMVESIGTGPWLAGVWFGDSQLGLLAAWLGQAIAAESWGGQLPLDYYIYSAFTENPGNQCFVESKGACTACIS